MRTLVCYGSQGLFVFVLVRPYADTHVMSILDIRYKLMLQWMAAVEQGRKILT